MYESLSRTARCRCDLERLALSTYAPYVWLLVPPTRQVRNRSHFLLCNRPAFVHPTSVCRWRASDHRLLDSEHTATLPSPRRTISHKSRNGPSVKQTQPRRCLSNCMIHSLRGLVVEASLASSSLGDACVLRGFCQNDSTSRGTKQTTSGWMCPPAEVDLARSASPVWLTLHRRLSVPNFRSSSTASEAKRARGRVMPVVQERSEDVRNGLQTPAPTAVPHQ